MTAPSDISQQMSERLLLELQKEMPDAHVQLQRTSSGWLHLNIITCSFEGLSEIEREQKIDAILAKSDLNLGGYPFADYRLQTPEEAATQEQIPLIQLPLWSEILMAPEPENPVSPDEDANKRPFVVTFYSFKGGVGRSTALAFVANILVAQGQRVVMIDFDIEAPGLSFLFESASSDTIQFGVLDYIHQRYLTPDQNQPNIAKCIRQINISTRGELYLIPAGEYDENYIHRLADLDIRLLYQQEKNPIHQLLDDVKEYLDPDIILIDARTGFTEMGAIALFDQADLGIICFSPTDQSFAGLQWVVKAASKQRGYYGIPDLRFLLTPMPAVAQSQQQLWIAHVAEWISTNWTAPLSVTVDELYYQVPYNPNITTLSNLSGEIPPGVLEAYMPIADAIAASLPEKKPSIPKLADLRTAILSELGFQAATAQEMNAEDIPTLFQRTGDFYRFLQDRTWLVRGAKGTGKTLLFRLFVETSEDAREFARPDTNLQSVQFIPGHGQASLRPTLLTRIDLESYEQQAGKDSWTLFWLNYMLLQLVAALPDLPQTLLNLDPQLFALATDKEPRHSDIIDWLVERALSPQAAPKAGDELRTIDRWLQQQNKHRIWLLYDELDVGFGQDYERRRRSLEGLMSWWVEIGPGLNSIVPKILLRDDIWIGLNFTNKAYFSARFVQLRWEEDDLWHLVLRQVRRNSPTLTDLMNQQIGIDLREADINKIGIESLRKSLYLLWGERMGRSRKAYTYNWVRKRISDSKNNRFPRSLIQLLQKAIDIEKSSIDPNQYEAIVRPRALIEALPFVSEQRVAEVRNEYPELAAYLDKLSGERSPIALDRLSEIWGEELDDLKTLVTSMIDAGILQEYLPSPDIELQRYAVAELYLYGLGMKRQGQR